MYAANRFDRSYGNRQIALTDDQLRRTAPSIFAEQPWERMTSKYLFIPTIEVIQSMRENGMVPVRAVQSRTRIEGKEAFTKHMVAFRDISKPMILGDVIPEVVLVNSHDGTSSYQLHAGMYRLVCSNGLLVADCTLDSIKCRHSKNVVDDIIEGTNTLIREVPNVVEKIEVFKSIELEPPHQLALAESVLALRYEEDAEHKPIEARQLLDVRRKDDKQPTLWNTFNAIEENMMKGGLFSQSPSGRRSKTRPIKGVSENMRLEKSMWALTQRMAELMGR